MGRLVDAIRKKHPDWKPRDVLRHLGLDESLIDVKRLAFDGVHKMKATRLEFLATTRAARGIVPLLATDAKVELGPIFKGLTTKNFKERKPVIMDGLKKALKGKTIAKDASIEHVAHMLDQLEHTKEPKSLDESVSEPQHKAMESAAHGQSNLGIPKDVGKEFAEADRGKSFGDMIRDWAMSKDWAGGMSDDDIEALNKMHEDAMPDDLEEDELPENALDEDETAEEKEAREKKEKEEKAAKDAKDAKTAKDKHAMDQRLKGMVTVDEMNTALSALTANLTKQHAETAEARTFVRPYVGEVSMALDSADKVLRAAATAMEIEDADKIHASALKTVIKECGRARTAAAQGADMANDSVTSATAKSFNERFPGADRIGTV